MWRLIVILGTFLFSLGALAGAVLIIMLLIDRELRPAAGVALGTAFFAWGAWACRRDWQRANQEAEFRASSREE